MKPLSLHVFMEPILKKNKVELWCFCSSVAATYVSLSVVNCVFVEL